MSIFTILYRQLRGSWCAFTSSLQHARRATVKDAHEITRNLTGFFTILAEWSQQKERAGSDADTRGGAHA